MKKYKIKFDSIDDINHFVNIVNRFTYSVGIGSGSVVIDAKSLQGVMAIGLNRNLVMTVHGEMTDDELMCIKPFMIEADF